MTGGNLVEMTAEDDRDVPREEWEPFAARLRRALAELKPKRPAMKVAQSAGTNSGNLSKMSKAKRGPPNGELLFKLARELDVRPEWLVTGEEPMRPGEVASLTVTLEPPTMRHLREVYESYEFPTTEVAGEIWEALRGEAFKSARGAPIGAAHWKKRIDEEIAARKGKRITHVVHDDPVEERKRARKATRS